AMNNFTARYAQALLAATRREDLAQPDRPKKIRGLSAEQMARMEREMDGLQREFKAVSASYGDTVLNLVVAAGYVSRLIGNPGVSGYLERHHPEILTEFRAIVATTSLEEGNSGVSEEPALGLRRHDQQRRRGSPSGTTISVNRQRGASTGRFEPVLDPFRAVREPDR